MEGRFKLEREKGFGSIQALIGLVEEMAIDTDPPIIRDHEHKYQADEIDLERSRGKKAPRRASLGGKAKTRPDPRSKEQMFAELRRPIRKPSKKGKETKN
jgi:hypothetical protein